MSLSENNLKIENKEVNDKSNDWKSIVVKYQKPDNRKAIFELCTTFIPFVVLWICAYKALSVSYLLSLFFIIVDAGFILRIFSIQHDCGHRTFMSSHTARSITGFICGIVTLTSYKAWKKIHNTHHAESGNITSRGAGDIALLTIKEYQQLSDKEKFKYRVMRHPLLLLGIAPFMLFFVFQRIPSYGVSTLTRSEKNSVHYNNLALLLVISVMSYFIGFKNFFIIQFPMSLLASTVGLWVFYVHHQFEDTYWAEREDFDFFSAAMKGSAYIELPKILQWFIGNTGYHHIHHLSPKIPAYNLPKCYNENPIFQSASKIGLIKGFKTFNLNLWDEENQKLIDSRTLN